MIEEAFNQIISFCEEMPECGKCPYYKGCRLTFPDRVLSGVLYDVINGE